MEITEYCIARNIELIGEYVDIDASGLDMNRPAFRQMLSDAQRHPEWNVIVVSNTSRVSRNALQLFECKEQLNNSGIRFVSVSEEQDDFGRGWLIKTLMEKG